MLISANQNCKKSSQSNQNHKKAQPIKTVKNGGIALSVLRH
jgi:hypothetical protein